MKATCTPFTTLLFTYVEQNRTVFFRLLRDTQTIIKFVASMVFEFNSLRFPFQVVQFGIASQLVLPWKRCSIICSSTIKYLKVMIDTLFRIDRTPSIIYLDGHLMNMPSETPPVVKTSGRAMRDTPADFSSSLFTSPLFSRHYH